MLLSELIGKYGFKLDYTVTDADGTNNKYSSKDFIIDEYIFSEDIYVYLLNKDTSHILEVDYNTDGDFTEWYEFFENIK